MLDIELRVKNYRCFGDEPVCIRITDGFIALIGTNNSGKSSLLRMPFELRNLFAISCGSQGTELAIGSNLGSIWHPVTQPGERAFRTGTDRPIELQIIVRDGPNGAFIFNGEQMILSVTYGRDGSTKTWLTSESGSTVGTPYRPYNGSTSGFSVNPFVTAMAVLRDAMYIGPFRNAINVGASNPYYDIQTGDAFIRSFAEYKSGNNPEQNEAVHRLLQEIKRIFGFESLDINPANEYKVLQLTVDGLSYRLAEQGAGLAHFIVVLVNVLLRRPTLLLIDEPELNLHASLQLDFLQTLAKYTQYGVIFATHSLGLARTAADRIYCLAKPVGGTSTVRQYERERELITLLGQLSFDRRPDLGFSKVLLVEGKTELRALMQILRLYGKEHEVLMLPLHGDEMIRGNVEQELCELLRIGGDIRYLIDSERSAQDEPLGKNRQAFVDLCTNLKISGHVLERRALENYFTEHAVKRAFGESTKALGPYEKKGAGQNWPKVNNWRAAAEVTRADLEKNDLGVFLDSL